MTTETMETNGTEEAHADAVTIMANRVAHFNDAPESTPAQGNRSARKSKREKAMADALKAPESTPAPAIVVGGWEQEAQTIELELNAGTSIGELAERFARGDSMGATLSSLRYGLLCHYAIGKATAGQEGLAKPQLAQRVEDVLYSDVTSKMVPYYDFREALAPEKKAKRIGTRIPEWLRAYALASAIPAAQYLGSAGLRACSSAETMRQEGFYWGMKPEWVKFLTTFIPQCVESGAKGDEILAGVEAERARMQTVVDRNALAAHAESLKAQLANDKTPDTRKAELTEELRQTMEKQTRLDSTVEASSAAPTDTTGSKPTKIAEKTVKALLARIAGEPDLAAQLGREVWSTTAIHAFVGALRFDKRNDDAMRVLAKTIVAYDLAPTVVAPVASPAS